MDLDTKPGEHKADVLFTMDDGRVDKRQAVIQVVVKKYPTTELKVDDKYVQLSKTRSRPGKSGVQRNGSDLRKNDGRDVMDDAFLRSYRW